MHICKCVCMYADVKEKVCEYKFLLCHTLAFIVLTLVSLALVAFALMM